MLCLQGDSQRKVYEYPEMRDLVSNPSPFGREDSSAINDMKITVLNNPKILPNIDPVPR
jgi:hypothetical protein